jgi:arylsulfatase A-like enzyme
MRPLATLLTICGCLFTLNTPIRAETPKLNIVIILADDLGAHDLGCTGSSFYETPNLDRLAKEGMLFRNAYSACPVCSPTRAAMMTGKYTPRVDITNFIAGVKKGKLLPPDYSHQLALDEVTIAEAFKEAGYATGFAGKWHLGPYKGFGPDAQGFTAIGPNDQQKLNQQIERGDKVTEFAVKFIADNKDKPFLLYLPHNLVHVPLIAKEELIAKYKKKAEKLPKIDDEKRFRKEGENKDRRVQDHPTYAAMMEDLDTNVGKVLKALDDHKLNERTLVIFTSDNGGLSTAEGIPTSNAPLRAGKGWLYEGGIRVPLIVRWTGAIKAGSVSDERVITCDFFPTCLEAAGLKLQPEKHKDGVSLLSILKGGDKFTSRPLYWHYPHYSNQGGRPGSAIIDEGWKLIHNYEEDRMELFHLKDDPNETTDLAKKNADKVAELRKKLDDWRKEVGAKAPTPNVDGKKKE